MTEWIAYEQITGPLGPERGDVLHGIQTAAVVNALRGKKGRKARGQDFVPKWDRAPQDWESMLATVKTMNKALGGADKTKHTHGQADDAGGRSGHHRRHPGRHRRQDR
ncbi:phage tail assembly protein T [Yinghuangia sp. YIM S09857]|uniref:phage tail assembly protein T n=1 Tax=Yinghuangia sp. YIM S09857 TaxID=3436929 RepID=UPI003F53D4AE